jgi:hypothetical protein
MAGLTFFCQSTQARLLIEFESIRGDRKKGVSHVTFLAIAFKMRVGFRYLASTYLHRSSTPSGLILRVVFRNEEYASYNKQSVTARDHEPHRGACPAEPIQPAAVFEIVQPYAQRSGFATLHGH